MENYVVVLLLTIYVWMALQLSENFHMLFFPFSLKETESPKGGEICSILYSQVEEELE